MHARLRGPARCHRPAPPGSSWGISSRAVGPCTIRPMALRVVFAEDNYLVREGTTALLSEGDRVEVVATAEDLDGLMAAVETERPDAVLTDIRMPPTNTREGIDAALRIRREHPDIGVVVLSQYVEGAYAFDLLQD